MSLKLFVRVFCVLVLLGLALAPCDVVAGTLGSVMGYLKNPEGLPVKGAQITLTGPAVMGKRTTTSDAQGFYRLTQIPPGEDFVIRYDAMGLGTGEIQILQVHAGMTLRIPDVKMCSRNVNHCYSFMQGEQSPMLDFSWAGTAKVIDQQLLPNLRR